MTQTEERAKQSRGTSGEAIYRMVSRAVAENCRHKETLLLDVGCGAGKLYDYVRPSVKGYEGVDIIQYESYPAHLPFHQLDLDQGRAPLDDAYADIVVAVETIEHLENPRAFVRELVRLCKPGGTIIVTTPNQLSLLSKLTLLIKNHFNAFADSCYPAHITALLEMDLHRIAKESGMHEIRTIFSNSSRVAFTATHFPSFVSRMNPRAFSDNIGIVARKCSTTR